MSKPLTPSAPKSPSANVVVADENYVALTFEDRLRIFWRKNRKALVILVVVLLLAILGKGAWEYREAQQEAEIGREFAGITTADKLNAFAAARSGHALAGIARLRAADEAYAAGKPSDAISGYEQAIATLKTGPLASRAKLGLAMARIQAGKNAEGEAALKQLAADASEAKGIRVEASYHLASIASSAGKADDVRKYSDQVMQLDPASPWAQRVFMLRASLPAETVPAASATRTIALPPPGK